VIIVEFIARINTLANANQGVSPALPENSSQPRRRLQSSDRHAVRMSQVGDFICREDNRTRFVVRTYVMSAA